MLGPAVFVGIGAVTIAVTLGPGDLWSLGPIGVDEGSASRAVLVAARDGEERVRFLGQDPAMTKLVAYVIAAVLASELRLAASVGLVLVCAC